MDPTEKLNQILDEIDQALQLTEDRDWRDIEEIADDLEEYLHDYGEDAA